MSSTCVKEHEPALPSVMGPELREEAGETTGSRSIPRSRMYGATALFLAAGMIGRVALQHVPSVETVLPVAIAVGFYGGYRMGAMIGAAGFFMTNFAVWGFHGPWTLFQCLGAAVAGGTAAGLARLSTGRKMFFLSLITGAVLYELVVNAGSFAVTPWAWPMGVGYFLAAVPFGLIHVASTIGFGMICYGFDDTLTTIYGTE